MGTLAGIVAGRLRSGQLAWPWERIAATGGLVCVIVALATRIDAGLAGATAATGAVLIGWALWPRERGRWATFCILNGAIAALFVWAGAERSRLTVEVLEDRVLASLGDVRLQATVPRSAGEHVSVGLAPATDRPLSARWAYWVLPGVAGVADWLNTGLVAGIENLAVETPPETPTGESSVVPGPAIWQSLSATGPPMPDRPLAGWELAEQDGTYLLRSARPFAGDHRVSLDLIRPSSAVTVGVRAPAGRQAAIAVVVAPDHRTMSIEQRLGSGQAETVAGGQFAYKRTWTEWLRAIGREMLRAWLWALTGLGLCRALAGSSWRVVGIPKVAIPAALVAWGLGVGTLAVTGMIATQLLEGIPHVQDSVTYLFQAQVFALGRLSAPAPPLPEFFQQEFVVVHEGKWFGKYTPGHPIVLAVGVLAGAPWLISPLAAAAGVVLTYLTGCRLFGQSTGLLAAGLLLVSPFFLFLSGSMMAHAVGLFWTSLALYAATRCRQADWVWGLTLGLAAGMLVITRPLSAAVVAPIIAVAVLEASRRPLDAVRFAAQLGVGAAAPIGFMLAFNWSLLGDPFRNPYELWWTFDRPGFGPGVGMHGPHDVANGLANTWANTVELMRHLLGWPAYLTLAPAVIPALTLSRDRWDWSLMVCPVALAGAYVFYWADGIMFGPRYYFEAIGAIALLSARGLGMLAQPLGLGPQASHGNVGPRFGLAPFVVGTVVVGLVGVTMVGYMPPMVGLHQGYNGVSRARLDLVEQVGLQNALVFVTQTWPDWQPYGSVFPANGPLLDGEVIYARDLGPDQNPRLMEHYPNRRAYLLRGLELRQYER